VRPRVFRHGLADALHGFLGGNGAEGCIGQAEAETTRSTYRGSFELVTGISVLLASLLEGGLLYEIFLMLLPFLVCERRGSVL
jgi:hypothetical protein